MKKQVAYAVFTTTESGADYMVQGNFGSDKEAAEKWAENNVNNSFSCYGEPKYPNGLFVKQIEY